MNFKGTGSRQIMYLDEYDWIWCLFPFACLLSALRHDSNHSLFLIWTSTQFLLGTVYDWYDCHCQIFHSAIIIMPGTVLGKKSITMNKTSILPWKERVGRKFGFHYCKSLLMLTLLPSPLPDPKETIVIYVNITKTMPLLSSNLSELTIFLIIKAKSLQWPIGTTYIFRVSVPSQMSSEVIASNGPLYYSPTSGPFIFTECFSSISPRVSFSSQKSPYKKDFPWTSYEWYSSPRSGVLPVICHLLNMLAYI